MAELPDDVYHQVFSYVAPSTLVNCRLLDRQVGAIATYYAFKHMKLVAAYDVHKFVNVAASDHLRRLVREVTIDTWIGPGFKYHKNGIFRPPRDFFRALAFLRFLPDLKTLNLRFNKWCGVDDNQHDTVPTEEDNEFRYLVLDTIFRSLADNWPSANRPLREEAFVPFSIGDRGSLPPLPTEGFEDSGDDERKETISIHTLTISNLADFNDERLTKSASFRKILSSKSFTSLKLLVTTPMPNDSPENAIRFPEKHDFFESLPHNWLSPPVAQNIKVLSLFFRDYWGWIPKMDLRTINPNKGASSGMPNLRVLALGCYVFSHEWQVEWITSSVGQQNGRGGLEELYLDDCPILWQARMLGPLDESTTVYESTDGNIIKCSNAGYALREMVMRGHEFSKAQKFSYPLRWNRVLKYWRDHLTSLKVFKMGHGGWDQETVGIKSMGRYEHPVPRVEVGAGDPRWEQDIARLGEECAHREQPLMHTTHLDYDCPSPPPERRYQFKHDPKYFHGVGLRHDRENILQYVHFDIGLGPTQWIERDNVRDMIEQESLEAYTLAQSEDEGAYEQLMGVVDKRK